MHSIHCGGRRGLGVAKALALPQTQPVLTSFATYVFETLTFRAGHLLAGGAFQACLDPHLIFLAHALCHNAPISLPFHFERGARDLRSWLAIDTLGFEAA